MLLNTLMKVATLNCKYIVVPFFLLIGSFCWAQNELEQKSFKFLGDYLEHHSSTNTLYFEYVKAYENKAQMAGDLEKIFYAKSEYIVHGTIFSEKLQHAQELLQLAKQKKNKYFIGIAYNKLALVYHMERDLEQSLHYELLAEELLSQSDDLYNLNKSRYGIGAVYYFLGDYEKALSFFTKTADYYGSKKEYNALKGFINSIQYKIKCLHKLERYGLASNLLDSIFPLNTSIRTKHKELNTAYFSLLKGQNLWAQKQYKESLVHLQKSLNVIKSNDDFANEHLVYLYIGKNFWALDKHLQAVKEFKKVDRLFTDKKYSDLILLEAYDYLIAFYKSKSDLQEQLFYTERLLKVTNELQYQNKGLSNVLHKKYETKKLETSRNNLQKELKVEIYKKYIIIGGAILIVTFLTGCVIYYRNKQKTLRKKYEVFTQQRLFSELNNTHIVLPEIQYITKVDDSKDLNYIDTNISKSNLSDKTTQELLQKLNLFETKKEYLNASITISTLAKDLNTNSRYLSEVINTCKKQNFASYINDLRISHLLKELHKNKKLRKLTISAIAEEFGFNNARSFSDAFFKITGLKPSYYISQIDRDEKEIVQ